MHCDYDGTLRLVHCNYDGFRFDRVTSVVVIFTVQGGGGTGWVHRRRHLLPYGDQGAGQVTHFKTEHTQLLPNVRALCSEYYYFCRPVQFLHSIQIPYGSILMLKLLQYPQELYLSQPLSYNCNEHQPSYWNDFICVWVFHATKMITLVSVPKLIPKRFECFSTKMNTNLPVVRVCMGVTQCDSSHQARGGPSARVPDHACGQAHRVRSAAYHCTSPWTQNRL